MMTLQREGEIVTEILNRNELQAKFFGESYSFLFLYVLVCARFCMPLLAVVVLLLLLHVILESRLVRKVALDLNGKVLLFDG